ncbi:MAG TPA: hypothetical protein VJV39_13830 [Dongiaceae bacterium]|nr:hypothetical protein [Dongiaceae bacterium]
MRYDFNVICELCNELGLSARIHGEQCVEVDLGPSGLLCFQNAEDDADCLIGFRGTPWHTHDDLTFVDGRGHYVELTYLDLLTGLADGQVLVCERLLEDKLLDRWPIHRDYNDVFKYMEAGEQIAVRRVTTTAAA